MERTYTNTKKTPNFINEPMNKGSLRKLLSQMYLEYGGAKAAALANALKDLGYKYATISGTTISNGAYAITSRINIDDISKLQISMWGCVGDPAYATVNYARSLIVGVITDPFNISTFVLIEVEQ